ncbi:MAG: hypothetical protein R3C99_00605 [Pirellulaceae bacterium]
MGLGAFHAARPEPARDELRRYLRDIRELNPPGQLSTPGSLVARCRRAFLAAFPRLVAIDDSLHWNVLACRLFLAWQLGRCVPYAVSLVCRDFPQEKTPAAYNCHRDCRFADYNIGIGSSAKLAQHRGFVAGPSSESHDGPYQPSRDGSPSISTFEGRWQLFLPAGFEREMNLVRSDGGQYTMRSGASNFNGRYKLNDGRLQSVELDGDQPSDESYTWMVRTPYMLVLERQTGDVGANYTSAILFRPQPETSRGESAAEVPAVELDASHRRQARRTAADWKRVEPRRANRNGRIA